MRFHAFILAFALSVGSVSTGFAKNETCQHSKNNSLLDNTLPKQSQTQSRPLGRTQKGKR